MGEAAETKMKMGSVLFNGRELNTESGSAILNSFKCFLSGWSKAQDASSKEASWQRMAHSLQCGAEQMKLRVVGHGASNFAVDQGSGSSLPLSQVPSTCGYTMQRNSLALIMYVPYDGCSVVQEDASYVLPMSWLGIPVTLTCPMLPHSDATPASTPLKSAQHPWNLPHKLWNLRRQKRHEVYGTLYDPRNPYAFYWQYYMMQNTPAPSTAPPNTTSSTTSSTTTTTTTTPPPMMTTTKPTEEQPPVYVPYYFYYPYYLFYPYYPLPNPTTHPTVAPTTPTGAGTTQPQSSTASTTTPASTTKAPEQSVIPYPPYFYFPHYLPLYQPNGSVIYYYPTIQHFYGKPQQPANPSQTTISPATPSEPSDTVKPSDSSPTTSYTTVSAPTSETTKPTSCKTTPTSNSYPGPMKSYVPYNELSFVPEVSHKAGQLPDHQKYMPQTAYKSGPQDQGAEHPSFNYWQPEGWFSHFG
uniref:Uncharacterized protein n=1 Tax=Echeneis naucrates TaxID=173247 RepID=A0A665TUG0_ECHNA